MLDKVDKFLGFREIRTLNFHKEWACEFIATGLLIVIGCGACVTMDSGNPLPTLTSALVSGMVVHFIVWTFNHISGAHINPAVTLGFLVTGHVSVAKTIAYFIAQCAGAIAGSGILWYMVPDGWRGTLATTTIDKEVSIGQAVAIEIFSTFTLMLGVFATSDQFRNDHAGSMPLAMGLIVFMESAWAGKLTGCSMNPARTLGPALISGTWDGHWVYWVGPVVGGVAGALFYQHLMALTPRGENMSIQIEPTSPASPQDSKPPTLIRMKDFTDKTVVIEPVQLIKRYREGLDNLAMDTSAS